jgi:hypothetical protein
MNRLAVIVCAATLCVGFFVGYAAHRSAVSLDHALEVGDLESEIELQKKLLAECHSSAPRAAEHKN